MARRPLTQEIAEFLTAKPVARRTPLRRDWPPAGRRHPLLDADAAKRNGEEEHEFTRVGQDIAWFDEGKDTLTRRVRQIQTGIHWAEEPVSRISPLVSNVRLIVATPSLTEPREVTARCRFLIYRNRVETETDILVGKREDLLRRAGPGWQIAHRKILLDQNVLLSKNLTFFF
jgi:3-phenylpropionate/cinnamic acid dioxygenase small subunit